MAKKLLISIVLISIISGIVIAGCGDNGSNQIVVPATGTPTQIASLVTIKGQALEVNGTPIPNAFVVCVNLGLSASLSTLADQLGNYIFRNLPPGTYRIEIWRTEGEHSSSPGSPIGAVNISVTEGSVTVNVTVGTIDPTSTPTATNTPGGPTNTPGGPTNTPTATNTPGGPTNTPTSTNTPVPTPAITGFTPDSGPVGTVVTIKGSYFGSAPTVRFNLTQATTVNVNGTGTQITATVPTGATTGKITVTTTAGTGTSATNFTVTALAWQVSDITMPDAASTILVDVHFVGTEGWIIGGIPAANGNIYRIQEPNTVTSFSVSTVAPRKKIVASNGTSEWCNSLYMKDSSHFYAVTNLGYLLFYNGTGWIRKSTSSTGLSSIHFPSEGGNGYCCGSNSIDSINTSSPPDITTFTPSPGSLNYTDIFALSSSNIWVSCPSNELWNYNGLGWTNKIGNLVNTVTSIYFVDQNNGWVLRESAGTVSIYKYNPSDEENWISQPLPSGLGSSVLLRDLFFINSSEGWIVGSNDNHALILHTTDGGDTWNIQYNDPAIPSLNALYMTSISKGYAVGYNNTVLIYK